MIPNAEMVARIQELRRKSNDGTITLEEQKEAILFLRQNRTAALTASKGSKKSSGGAKKKAPISADALLGELDNM